MTVAVGTSPTQTVHAESLEGLTTLREVGLFRHEVDVENEHQCAAWGPVTKFDADGRLIYLDLGGCRLRKGLPDGVVKVFGNQLYSIQTLNLGGTDLPSTDTLQLLLMLRTLSCLHLGGNGLGDAGIRELARDWLPQATQLHTLDLRYNDVTPVGCEALCQSLLRQPHLSLAKLYLEGNRIQDQGAESLANFLEKNSSLQEIFLGANAIGSSGGAALASCLKTNKTISKIYLEGNSLGPTGAEAFTKALLECNGDTALKHLFVDNNDIGKEGSIHLANAVNSGTAIGDALL